MEHSIPQSMTGLLIAAVVALAGCIVTLALYIRKIHNKHTEQILHISKEATEQVLSNSKEITSVCADVTNSVDKNTESNNRLSTTINELYKHILKI